MAKVRLGRFEAEEGRVPRVCMRCGAPATTQRERNFRWTPPWIGVLIFAGLLPYIIVARIMEKRMRVVVPLCEVHQHHWRVRAWIAGGVFVGVVGLGILTVVAMSGNSDTIGGMLCGLTMLALFGWFVALVVCQETAIHPSEITDYSITLKRVSPMFVEAVGQRVEDFRPQPRFDEERGRPSPQYRPPDEQDYFDPKR